jgi:hypothetical protein
VLTIEVETEGGSMTDNRSTPLLDDDGRLRMHRFIVATLSSAVVIAACVAVAMHAADPSGGWNVALGIGAMIGFWTGPLAGALIGNGFHEVMKDRAEAHDGTPTGDAHPVAA